MDPSMRIITGPPPLHLRPQWVTTEPSGFVAQLQAAAETGDISFLKDALSCRPPTGHDLGIYIGALSKAIQAGQFNCVKFLLTNGVPLQILHIEMAIRSKLYDALEIFLNTGWDINRPLGRWRGLPLGLALGDEPTMKWLLAHGATPNAQNKFNVTAMAEAVESGSISDILLLIDYGGNAEHGDVLHSAVRRQLPERLRIIELLLEMGTGIDRILYQDCPQRQLELFFMDFGTPLHTAVEEDIPEIVKLLLQHGADPTIKSSRGYTVIEKAQKLQRHKIIDILTDFPRLPRL